MNGSTEKLYIMMTAMTEFCRNNPSDTVAASILQEIEDKFASKFEFTSVGEVVQVASEKIRIGGKG